MQGLNTTSTNVMQQPKPESFFYIHNTSKLNLLLFEKDEDYLLFLKLFFEHISPIASLCSYCLLPQQFHLLLKFKTEKEIFTYFKIEGKFPDETMTLDELNRLSNANGLNSNNILSLHISKQLNQFITNYQKAKTPQQKTNNQLFETKHVCELLQEVNSIKDCIYKMHLLPIESKFCKEMNDWKYSSYNAIISDKPTKLMREEVINIFSTKEEFILHHQNNF